MTTRSSKFVFPEACKCAKDEKRVPPELVIMSYFQRLISLFHLLCTAELEADKTWRELLYDYSQNTTFHGVKFIAANSQYRVRRIVWLCVLGTAMTVFVSLFIARYVSQLKQKHNGKNNLVPERA